MMKFYYVTAEYNGYDPAFDREMEKAVGRTCNGSGFGLGFRDLSWHRKTKQAALRIFDILRGISIRGKGVRKLDVSMRKYEDDQ